MFQLVFSLKCSNVFRIYEHIMVHVSKPAESFEIKNTFQLCFGFLFWSSLSPSLYSLFPRCGFFLSFFLLFFCFLHQMKRMKNASFLNWNRQYWADVTNKFLNRLVNERKTRTKTEKRLHGARARALSTWLWVGRLLENAIEWRTRSWKRIQLKVM